MKKPEDVVVLAMAKVIKNASDEDIRTVVKNLSKLVRDPKFNLLELAPQPPTPKPGW